MIERIKSGWTIRRVLYLVLGLIVLVQALVEKQWLGALFGAWFAGMGLLGVGCAGGACANPYLPKPESFTPKQINHDPISKNIR